MISVVPLTVHLYGLTGSVGIGNAEEGGSTWSQEVLQHQLMFQRVTYGLPRCGSPPCNPHGEKKHVRQYVGGGPNWLHLCTVHTPLYKPIFQSQHIFFFPLKMEPEHRINGERESFRNAGFISPIMVSPTFNSFGIHWDNGKISDLKGMPHFPHPH